jgi:hypothetical protein
MRHLLSFIVVATIWAAPVNAAPIVFTDSAAFDAAIGFHDVLTFDEPRTYVLDRQALFSYWFIGPFVFASDYFYNSGVYGGFAHAGSAPLGMSLGVPQPYIGFDIDAFTDYEFQISVFTSGPSLDFILAGDSFFGLLLDDGDVLGVGLFPFVPSQYHFPPFPDPYWRPFNIDNVRYVPEPSTLLLFGSAMVMLTCRRLSKVL